MSSKRILRVLTSRQVAAVRRVAREDGMTFEKVIRYAVEDYVGFRKFKIASLDCDYEHIWANTRAFRSLVRSMNATARSFGLDTSEILGIHKYEIASRAKQYGRKGVLSAWTWLLETAPEVADSTVPDSSAVETFLSDPNVFSEALLRSRV